MQWNPLVPELSVSDFAKSLRFYTEGVGFAVQYTRDNPSFAYLDLGGAQIMIEQDHPDGWSTGALESPRGRGINLQIEVPDVNAVRARLLVQQVDVFREPHDSWYDTAEGRTGQREFLVLDPDGYLIRLVQLLEASATA